MRRRLALPLALALALATAIAGLAVAGFLSAPPSTSLSAASAAPRALTSPLVDMEAVPAASPRIGSFDNRLRVLSPRTAEPAVLLLGGALALAAMASILRGRRPGKAAARAAARAHVRGPPRLAAL